MTTAVTLCVTLTALSLVLPIYIIVSGQRMAETLRLQVGLDYLDPVLTIVSQIGFSYATLIWWLTTALQLIICK